MSDEIIILYGTSWCPHTARARKCLDDWGVKYIWCDIEKDLEGCAFVEKVNHGNRSVPTIVFPDSSILVEPSNAEIENHIQLRRSTALKTNRNKS